MDYTSKMSQKKQMIRINHVSNESCKEFMYQIAPKGGVKGML